MLDYHCLFSLPYIFLHCLVVKEHCQPQFQSLVADCHHSTVGGGPRVLQSSAHNTFPLAMPTTFKATCFGSKCDQKNPRVCLIFSNQLANDSRSRSPESSCPETVHFIVCILGLAQVFLSPKIRFEQMVTMDNG